MEHPVTSIGVANDPLLLLHGGGPGVDAENNWTAVREELARNFDCVTPDLLGFGGALTEAVEAGVPRGPRAWALERAQQVIGEMDRAGIARASIVGNSAAGGAAALALAVVAPERVSRLVLMGGAGTGPLPKQVPFYDEPTLEGMRATLRMLVADPAPHARMIDELAVVRYAQALRPGAELAFRAMYEPDTDSAARVIDPATVQAPTLLLHGAEDRVSSRAVSESLAARIDRSRLTIVEGAGHWIHVDKPERFCDLLKGFLQP